MDIAIEEQQSAIAVGIRAGTRPSAIIIPPSSPTDVKNGPTPDNTALFALAEVATSMHAASPLQVAQKPSDVLQPPISAVSTTVSIWNEPPVPETPTTQIVVEDKPVSEEKPEVKPSSKPKQQPKQQPKKKDRRASSRKAPQAQTQDDSNNVDEKEYCFCNRISFGNVSETLIQVPTAHSIFLQMIACDGLNCQKEWVSVTYR